MAGTHSAHVIDYRQDPEAPPVGQAVGQEIEAPPLMRRVAGGGSTRGRTDALLAPLSPGSQPFLAIEPVDPLVVDPPAFPPQQDVQPPVAVAHPRRRQVAQPQPQRRLIGR